MDRRTFGTSVASAFAALVCLPLMAMKGKPVDVIKRIGDATKPASFKPIIDESKLGFFGITPVKPTILDELDEAIEGYYPAFYCTKPDPETHYIAVTREAMDEACDTYDWSDVNLYKGFRVVSTLPPNTTPRVQIRRINRTLDDTQPIPYCLPRFLGTKEKSK